MLATTSKRLLSKGLIVPVYFNNTSKTFESNSFVNESLIKKLSINNKNLKPGANRTFYFEESVPNYDIINVVNLTEKPSKKPNYNQVNSKNEFIRTAIANSVKTFSGSNLDSVDFQGFESNQLDLISEAAHLTVHSYKEKDRAKFPTLNLNVQENQKNETTVGQIYADSQNFARDLMEAPANLMTPEIFGETVKNKIEEWNLSGNTEVIIRDEQWIKDKKMNSFLSVSAGSVNPPILLEIHVNKPKDSSDIIPEITYVGKGVTFDTGGISLKPSANMDAMRADMGGAATTTAAILSAARLESIQSSGKYFVCICPLCENMPSGNATKPGDVVTAMNGKTIQIDNTDAEGRLILADALTYADRDLREILDAATLTGAMMIALGSGASGVFTRSNTMYSNLEQAGYETGDRVWRMPLFSVYTDKITKSPTADLNNIGPGRGGGACTAAAFLGEFVENENWAHVDIAGVMDASDAAYVSKGMSGRPTRTFLKYLEEKLA